MTCPGAPSRSDRDRPRMRAGRSLRHAAPCALLAAALGAHAAAPLDVLTFGDAASEQAHRLAAERSDIVAGALGLPARQLLAPATLDWRGGALTFAVGVDPRVQNYVTLTLWGGEANHNRLALSCEGKQIGARHLGDIDLLDLGSVAPMFDGRFFHNTSPLPLSLTAGKQELLCRIDASGPVWPYGQTFDKFQKNMTEPARPMYALTVHTEPLVAAGAAERKGRAGVAKVRPAPGPEVLDAVKRRVSGAVDKLIAARRPLNQPEMLFLARAFDVDWTPAWRSDKVGALLVRAFDAYFAAFRADPAIASFDPATFNPEWFGFGPAAQAIMLRHAQLAPMLDQLIADPNGGMIARRSAYVEMLAASREWHRMHRRFYTNQSMINDTYGIYLPNRAIALLDPAKALPEQGMLRYLYESVGLEPWRGDDLAGGGSRYMSGGPDGSAKGAYRVGLNYYQVTDKGLTRELGFVGNYGEVLDWVASMYEATRPAPGQPGDARLLAQLLKIAKARAVFRYPLADAEGYRAMQLESVIGWRDLKYPGGVVYGQRDSWDATGVQVAAITRDPSLVAYAQQMFGDNQFFRSLRDVMGTDSLRVNMGLLDTPGQYAVLSKMAPQRQRLPMSEGEPDLVFSDEEDGVVAVKVGKEIFYASLYWRALNAVNGLAKVHYMTPQLDRMAVVHEDVQFEPSGRQWPRPEPLMGGSGPSMPPFAYPGAVTADTGRQLPIAQFPHDYQGSYGDVSPYAGKGEFYTLRYGPFTVAMNTTTGKTFELAAPAHAGLRELVAGKPVAPGARLVVKPRSTIVLYQAEGS